MIIRTKSPDIEREGPRDIQVRKSSGAIEDLNIKKLRVSLQRSGADRKLTDEIIKRILQEIEPFTNTKKIYRLAKKYLKKYNHASGLRYSLKRALFGLGPSGYPFEKFYGEVLKHYGYKVDVGILMNGKCVKHEVDVFAVRDQEVSVVECKYHNRPGTGTDVKVAMYLHSRLQDLRPVIAARYPGRKFNGYLVTNTRCTSDALRYAKCAGFHVRSWGYPPHDSLQKIIEDHRLYPVTILADVKTAFVRRLLGNNIIMLKDLASMDTGEIRRILSVQTSGAEALKKKAESVCVC